MEEEEEETTYKIVDSIYWAWPVLFLTFVLSFFFIPSTFSIGFVAFNCGRIASDYEIGTCLVVNGSAPVVVCDEDGSQRFIQPQLLEVQITRANGEMISPTASLAGGTWCSGSLSPPLPDLLEQHPIGSSFDCWFRSDPRDYPPNEGLIQNECFDTPDLWAYDNNDQTAEMTGGFIGFLLVGICMIFVMILSVLFLFLYYFAAKRNFSDQRLKRYLYILLPFLVFQGFFVLLFSFLGNILILISILVVVPIFFTLTSPIFVLLQYDLRVHQARERQESRERRKKFLEKSFYKANWWDRIEKKSRETKNGFQDPCEVLPLDNLISIFSFLLHLRQGHERKQWKIVQKYYKPHFSNLGRMSSVSKTWNYFTSHPRLWKRIAEHFVFLNENEPDSNFDWKQFVLKKSYLFNYDNRLTTKLYEKLAKEKSSERKLKKLKVVELRDIQLQEI